MGISAGAGFFFVVFGLVFAGGGGRSALRLAPLKFVLAFVLFEVGSDAPLH